MIVANVGNYLPYSSVFTSRELTLEKGLKNAMNMRRPAAEGLALLDTTLFLGLLYPAQHW